MFLHLCTQSKRWHTSLQYHSLTTHQDSLQDCRAFQVRECRIHNDGCRGHNPAGSERSSSPSGSVASLHTVTDDNKVHDRQTWIYTARMIHLLKCFRMARAGLTESGRTEQDLKKQHPTERQVVDKLRTMSGHWSRSVLLSFFQCFDTFASSLTVLAGWQQGQLAQKTCATYLQENWSLFTWKTTVKPEVMVRHVSTRAARFYISPHF